MPSYATSGLRRSARIANRNAAATASSSNSNNGQQTKPETATVPTLEKDGNSSVPTQDTSNSSALKKDDISSLPALEKDNNPSMPTLKEDNSSSLQSLKEDDSSSVPAQDKDDGLYLSALEKDDTFCLPVLKEDEISSLRVLEKDDPSSLSTLKKDDTSSLPTLEKDDISSFPVPQKKDNPSLPILKEGDDTSSSPTLEKNSASILPILEKHDTSNLRTLEKDNTSILPPISSQQYVISDEVPTLTSDNTHTKENQTLAKIDEALEILKQRQIALPKVPCASKSSTANGFEEMFQRHLIKMGAPALQSSSPLNEEKKLCPTPIYDKRKRYAGLEKERHLWKDLMAHHVEYERALVITELEYLYEEEIEARIRASRPQKGTKRRHWQMMEQEAEMFATSNRNKKIKQFDCLL